MSSPLIPAYDRANVVVGMAAIYYQPYDPNTPPVMPDDTVLLGEAWPSPWEPIGATHEGVTLGFSRETTDINIEEQSTPVTVVTTTAAFNFTTVLAEDTLETWLLAFGGGEITAVAATATEWGYEDLTIYEEMTDFSLGFEGQNTQGYPRRFVVPVVRSVAQVESAYRRADKHMYSVTFRSLSALADSPIHNISAEPTG